MCSVEVFVPYVVGVFCSCLQSVDEIELTCHYVYTYTSGTACYYSFNSQPAFLSVPYYCTGLTIGSSAVMSVFRHINVRRFKVESKVLM